MIPQIITLFLFLAGLLVSANQHGKQKEGKHNFLISLVAVIINFSLLYWGGYFNCFFQH